MPLLYKTCGKCKEFKPLEEFMKGEKYHLGRRGTCKKCHAANVRQTAQDNPDKTKANYEKHKHKRPAWKRHGLTETRYNQLRAMYDGKCHSCKKSEGKYIDHDHACCDKNFSCGRCVRGLLCHHCNTALGLLKDNPANVRRLLEYVTLSAKMHS